jgi:hypothetical protein
MVPGLLSVRDDYSSALRLRVAASAPSAARSSFGAAGAPEGLRSPPLASQGTGCYRPYHHFRVHLGKC